MDRPKYPSDEADKFMLRLPHGVRERIAALAKESGRSMNAEIVARLQSSFEAGADPAFDVRVREQMNEARLDAVRSQMYTVEMHVEVLSQRLDTIRREKRSMAEHEAAEQRLAVATQELEQLRRRQAILIEESRELSNQYSAAVDPARKAAERAANEALQHELSEVAMQEKARMQALLELQPTSEEIQAVAEIVAERERERSERIRGMFQPKVAPAKKARAAGARVKKGGR